MNNLEVAIKFYSSEIGREQEKECRRCAIDETSEREAEYQGVSYDELLNRNFLHYLMIAYRGKFYRDGG